jgi:hypothetical protein
VGKGIVISESSNLVVKDPIPCFDPRFALKAAGEGQILTGTVFRFRDAVHTRRAFLGRGLRRIRSLSLLR